MVLSLEKFNIDTQELNFCVYCSISKFIQIKKAISNVILGKYYLIFKEIKAFYRHRLFKYIFTLDFVK